MRLSYLVLPLLVSCTATAMYSGLNMTRFSKSDKLQLDSVSLTQAELPEGYSFVNKIYYPDMQTAIFIKEPSLYDEIIGGGSVKQIAQQSFSGPNQDIGTIFYVFYYGEINPDTKYFLNGLFYGESGLPSASHPEEFLTLKNSIVIWGLQPNSPIKRLAQQKLYDYFSRAK